MLGSRSIALVAVMLVGSSLLAQRTWVVDRWTRTGTDFSDLASAIAAAADGDVILLRATTSINGSADYYQLPNVQGKGLILVGERGPGLPPVGIVAGATISNVPSTSAFMFHDVTIVGANSADLTLTNNPGAIVFRNTALLSGYSFTNTWSGCSLVVFEGANVMLLRERLLIQQSNVMMSNTQVSKAMDQYATGIPPLVLSACTVHMDRCTLIGGSRSTWSSSCSEALVLEQGTTVRMSAETQLRGGQGFTGPCNSITSVIGTNSVHYDLSTSFVGGFASGTSAFAMSPQTGIRTTNVGNTIHVDQSQPSLAPTLMVMAPFASTPWTNGIGPVYLDPNFVWASFDIAPLFGMLRRSLTVPSTLPRGQWVGVQAFALDPQTGNLLTSNASVVGVW